MTAPSTVPDLELMASSLTLLRQRLVEHEGHFVDALARIRESDRPSALNLIHYLAVRQHDIRELQRTLHQHGLSSLGRMEAYVASTLDAVLKAVAGLSRRELPTFPSAPVTFDEGRRRLGRNTARLLGDPPPGREVRVMVTMPEESAHDYGLVRQLVAAGMNVARINGAKDSADMWTRMLEHLARAQRETGRVCRVQVDLEGPNPRTGPVTEKVRLEVGDRLRLVGDGRAAVPARREDDGSPGEPAVISCTLPAALSALKTGDRVSYDDGAFDGNVIAVEAGGVVVEVTRTAKARCKLKANKGLNFPDSDLGLPSVTADDEVVLDFAAANADIVALSFVRTPEDVHILGEALSRRRASHVGIVLKIETRRAFEQLPYLLLAGLAYPPVGVMVARGDMGVELGFERLAEAQEEILWMCEAAHVPVIWATQVLESLAKSGLPSRAEVTDAAMSGRAECVMLNKGDYIVDTVRFLDDVLRRMQDHQQKRLTMLRKLRIAGEPTSPLGD